MLNFSFPLSLIATAPVLRDTVIKTLRMLPCERQHSGSQMLQKEQVKMMVTEPSAPLVIAVPQAGDMRGSCLLDKNEKALEVKCL